MEMELCSSSKARKSDVKSFPPVILPPVLRKKLSLITIDRLKSEAQSYISQSQTACRRGRSMMDTVWGLKWHRARVQKTRRNHIYYREMTATFDTIDGNKLMDINRNLCELDGKRMIRELLSSTKLSIEVKDYISEEQILA